MLAAACPVVRSPLTDLLQDGRVPKCAGVLQILGSTGPLAGGAYRGAAKGMTGGTLLIHGNAGSEAGLVMRRGLIAIGGNCDDFPAFNMRAGALFVFGNAGLNPGAGMRRGTLALLGSQPVSLLPTFRFSAGLQPTAFRLVLRRLERLQFPVDPALYAAPIEMFRGDLSPEARANCCALEERDGGPDWGQKAVRSGNPFLLIRKGLPPKASRLWMFRTLCIRRVPRKPLRPTRQGYCRAHQQGNFQEPRLRLRRHEHGRYMSIEIARTQSATMGLIERTSTPNKALDFGA
ncbi:MAG UNVERIFIED_CONTAM: hypothetical protein LVR18_48880 [Planctomycetaceae bacterium]|jgi:hypothetical protein